MRCERLLNVRNAHLNGVKKESVQAACSSELFPSGGAAFGRNQIGLDHPETEGKAGGIGVTGSLAGSSRTEFILRLLEKRGWTARGSKDALPESSADCRGLSPVSALAFELEGGGLQDSGSQGTRQSPPCPTSTRDSGVWARPLEPAARQVPVSGRRASL